MGGALKSNSTLLTVELGGNELGDQGAEAIAEANSKEREKASREFMKVDRELGQGPSSIDPVWDRFKAFYSANNAVLNSDTKGDVSVHARVDADRNLGKYSSIARLMLYCHSKIIFSRSTFFGRGGLSCFRRLGNLLLNTQVLKSRAEFGNRTVVRNQCLS